MKILAPIVITGLLSLFFYRRTGTLTPVEVYPQSRYTMDAGGDLPKGTYREMPQYTEGAIDMLEDRKFGGKVQYPKGGKGTSPDQPIEI